MRNKENSIYSHVKPNCRLGQTRWWMDAWLAAWMKGTHNNSNTKTTTTATSWNGKTLHARPLGGPIAAPPSLTSRPPLVNPTFNWPGWEPNWQNRRRRTIVKLALKSTYTVSARVRVSMCVCVYVYLHTWIKTASTETV